MTPLTLLSFANLFFAGMLAGIETAVHYGVGAPPQALSEQSQIQLRQLLILKLRVLVPIFFVPTLASAVALIVLDRSAPGLWLRYAALGALLLWIVIRVIRTVPINSATLTWNPAAPPQNWRCQVESAERFHVLGVWVSVIAFISVISAMASNPSVPK